MKRPDTFVCFDKMNKKGLCNAFGISHSVGYEKYWVSSDNCLSHRATIRSSINPASASVADDNYSSRSRAAGAAGGAGGGGARGPR